MLDIASPLHLRHKSINQAFHLRIRHCNSILPSDASSILGSLWDVAATLMVFGPANWKAGRSWIWMSQEVDVKYICGGCMHLVNVLCSYSAVQLSTFKSSLSPPWWTSNISSSRLCFFSAISAEGGSLKLLAKEILRAGETRKGTMSANVH